MGQAPPYQAVNEVRPRVLRLIYHLGVGQVIQQLQYIDHNICAAHMNTHVHREQRIARSTCVLVGQQAEQQRDTIHQRLLA